MKSEKKWTSLMKKLNLILSSFVILLISACSSIPKNTADGCSIFSERYLWYKHAKKTEQKWGTPIYIQLAFIKMESDFDWLAKPKRKKIFKVIPYKRPSSSFGYSQAVKGTWKQYKKETGNKFATRTRFKDSVDFIGWYTNKTEKILKISKKDSFKQYLAYHEGWGNFKNYKNNQKVILIAKKVQKQSDNASELAQRLPQSSIFDEVIYPGLDTHPQHGLAKKQQLTPEGVPIYGSMISVKCGSVQKRDDFLSNLRLFTLAESLGGVESLVCAPYGMTHASVPTDMKLSMGLTEDLVRLSIGIEHIEDLYEDIMMALKE